MNLFILVALIATAFLLIVLRRRNRNKTWDDLTPASTVIEPTVPIEYDGRGAKWSRAATSIVVYLAMFGEKNLGDLGKLARALNRTETSFVRKVTRLETTINGNDGDPTGLDLEVYKYMRVHNESTCRVIAMKAITISTINPECRKYFQGKIALI